MSSTEITTCEDACKRPNILLPIELRMKVYEELLVRRDGSLNPNGLPLFERNFDLREKDEFFISILLTCRTIYEEALPVLYGKNVLAFHDNYFRKPMLPFPEQHLLMIKHVEVQMRPLVYSSAEKMGNFLMLLGTSQANLVDILIRISTCEAFDRDFRYLFHRLPPLSLFDRFLVGDHPIVAGLFSLKKAKKMVLQVDNDVRFEPGVANALKEAFMKEGTAGGRSITILRPCYGPQKDYEDDMLSQQAVEQFVLKGGVLGKRKSAEAESTTWGAFKQKRSLAKTKALKKNDTTTG